MKSYHEQIGRAGIVIRLMVIAVVAAAIAQDRSKTFRSMDEQLVILDGVAEAAGE